MATKNKIMDEILSIRTPDGLVPVYFSAVRPRIGVYLPNRKRKKGSLTYALDVCVCVNVLTLFYQNNRGHELDTVLDWVYACLQYRAYLDGTYFYTTEAFLYFLSRLISRSDEVRERFKPLFRERISERFTLGGDSLALAMRILAGATVGLISVVDYEKLLSMQEEDGSWANTWYYKFPRTSMLIGNDGLATALAVKAIETVVSHRRRQGVL